jgi:hypothetical protein
MGVSTKRPIRIGNASGAIGDGLDQLYRLAEGGNVDAITADYLAEFNIAWKAIEVSFALPKPTDAIYSASIFVIILLMIRTTR